MKFICKGNVLADAVLKTSKACPARTTAPILECIRIRADMNGVELLATDGELSIRKKVKAEIFEEGEICVPGKLFSDFASKLPDVDVTLAASGTGMKILYGDSVFDLQTLPAEEFPKIDFEIGENYFVMKRSALKKVIGETVFCCATDDSRPILKGCLFEFKEKLEVTALDGYRLALSSADLISAKAEKSIICPAGTLGEISRMLPDDGEEITVYTQGGMLLAGTEDMTIVSRLYQGEFIRKENILSSEYKTMVTFRRAEMISSVERASILVKSDRNNLITLEIGKNLIKIGASSDIGRADEAVAAQTEGKELVISMNAKFLLDALRALGEEEAVLSFNGPISPFILQNAQKKDSLYLILPVRNMQ